MKMPVFSCPFMFCFHLYILINSSIDPSCILLCGSRLADKERVAAALENPALRNLINNGIVQGLAHRECLSPGGIVACENDSNVLKLDLQEVKGPCKSFPVFCLRKFDITHIASHCIMLYHIASHCIRTKAGTDRPDTTLLLA